MEEETAKVASEVEELPKTIVRRIVKNRLSALDGDGDGDIALHKDALLAFSESARIFIHYLSATANDICKEAKRQTINADDVLKALEETEFPEFIGPLRASLDEFRKKNNGKKEKAKAKDSDKRKEEPLKESAKRKEVHSKESAKRKKEPSQAKESSKKKKSGGESNGTEERSENGNNA